MRTEAGDVWQPEEQLEGWFDLRTRGQMAQQPAVGTVQCCLLGVTSVAVSNPSWIQLAASKDSPVAVASRSLELLLSLPDGSLTGTTLSDLAFEFAAEDTDLAAGRKPISPNRNGVFVLNIGGRQVFSKPMQDEPAAWDQVRLRVAADYAGIRQESLKNGDEIYLKYLYEQAARYRVDYRVFLEGLPDEGVRKPTTTYSDDFNRASLGTDWTATTGTWGIGGSTYLEVTTDSGDNRVRYDCGGSCALSTDDHDGTITHNSGTLNWVGIAVRWSGSSEDFYTTNYRHNQAGGINKVVSGSASSVCSGGTDTIPTVHRLVVDGSSLEAFQDGTSKCSTTDSTHTGYLYSGVADNRTGSQLDDFSVTDIAAATSRLIIIE